MQRLAETARLRRAVPEARRATSARQSARRLRQAAFACQRSELSGVRACQPEPLAASGDTPPTRRVTSPRDDSGGQPPRDMRAKAGALRLLRTRPQIEGRHLVDVANDQDAVAHRRVVPRLGFDGGEARDLLVRVRVRAYEGELTLLREDDEVAAGEQDLTRPVTRALRFTITTQPEKLVSARTFADLVRLSDRRMAFCLSVVLERPEGSWLVDYTFAGEL